MLVYLTVSGRYCSYWKDWDSLPCQGLPPILWIIYEIWDSLVFMGKKNKVSNFWIPYEIIDILQILDVPYQIEWERMLCPALID